MHHHYRRADNTNFRCRSPQLLPSLVSFAARAGNLNLAGMFASMESSVGEEENAWSGTTAAAALQEMGGWACRSRDLERMNGRGSRTCCRWRGAEYRQINAQ